MTPAVGVLQDVSMDLGVPNGSWLALLIVLVSPAIGCGGGGGGADAGTETGPCGVVGPTGGTECHSLSECGGGMLNFRQVTFCEHCFAYGDTHLCEAGKCKKLEPGTATNINAVFVVPPVGDGAKSLTIATIDPFMADGSRITCAALKSSCMFVNNGRINAAASRFRNFAPTPATATMVYRELIAADPGEERLVHLQLTTEVQGRGAVKAAGCIEHVRVAAGQTTEVAVDLVAL